MDTAIVVAIVAFFDSVICAVIAGLFSHFNHKNDKYRAKREEEEAKAREINAASIGMQFAMADCIDVLLRKAHGDHLNGEVQEARTSLKRQKGRLNELANDLLAKAQGGS